MALAFSNGERVLCYHGPLMYEAKVLKSETWDEANSKVGSVGPHFFVHYKGWKQSWDEWVPLSRLLKYSEENVANQKQLMEEHRQALKLAKVAAGTSASASKMGAKGVKEGAKGAGARKEGAPRGTKRAREEDDVGGRLDLKLTIPDTLKAVLVDDWENVTRKNQLVALPRPTTVRLLLHQFRTQYLSQVIPSHVQDSQQITEFILGIQAYFDRALGKNLLYRFERPQYAEIRKNASEKGKKREMSEVYGAEHLLRMIVNLPTLVANTNMNLECINTLRIYLDHLLNFMLVNRQRIFLSDYETASSQYQNLSRS